MSDALATYLEDHLAGAAFAVTLLETLRDDHANEPLGRFAAELLGGLEADRAGRRPLAGLPGPLAPFEATETLALGIQGKLALWRALTIVMPTQPRLRGIDLDRLIAR